MRLHYWLFPLLMTTGTAAAQDQDLFSNTSFDELFGNFDAEEMFASSNESPRHLRLQLNHQLTVHANRHHVYSTYGSDWKQVHSVEMNRLELDIRYQNAFAPGWLLQGSALARGWLDGDYEHNNPDRGDGALRLNELFVRYSGGQHSFAFGRQIVVWGETIGNSVLDVINPYEFNDLTSIDYEDARRNQWLLTWDLFTDKGNLSSFINLYPEFDPLPVTGGPLYPEPQKIMGVPMRLSSYHRDGAIFEAGARWSRSFSGSDIAVMAARLYENPLRYTLPDLVPMFTLAAMDSSPADGPLQTEAVTNAYKLLGFSANRAISKLLLTLDVAYSMDVLSDVMTTTTLPNVGVIPVPGFKKRNRIAVSGGFEYGISPTQQMSLSVSATRDHGVDLNTRGNVLLRYSKSLRNEELVLSSTLQSQLGGDATLLFLGVDWRLNDDWEAEFQLVTTHTHAHTLVYHLDEDVRMGMTLKWNFY